MYTTQRPQKCTTQHGPLQRENRTRQPPTDQRQTPNTTKLPPSRQDPSKKLIQSITKYIRQQTLKSCQTISLNNKRGQAVPPLDTSGTKHPLFNVSGTGRHQQLVCMSSSPPIRG